MRYEAVIYDAGFGVFFVHPPMASVLLSASVERFSVSRMRDFFKAITKTFFFKTVLECGEVELLKSWVRSPLSSEGHNCENGGVNNGFCHHYLGITSHLKVNFGKSW